MKYGQLTVHYHYWIPPDWRSLYWYWQLDEQCRCMVESGLHNHASIFITITMPYYWGFDSRNMPFELCGDTKMPTIFGLKVEEYLQQRYPFLFISFRDSGEENIFEGATLVKLHEDARERPNSKFLYIHNKGTCSASPQVRVWFDALNNVNITNWEKCVDELVGSEYNVVGCRDNTVRMMPDQRISHVSGNFFWAKGEYIANLEKPLFPDRYDYERWITSGAEDINTIRYIHDFEVDPFLEYINV